MKRGPCNISKKKTKAQCREQEISTLHSSKRAQGIKSNILPASLSSKKAQMQISFGMIFSIILIIIFIAFAVYGVSKFLNMNKGIQIENFKKNLQMDVKNIYQSSQGSNLYNYQLPNKVIKVCFKDDAYNNMQIISEKSFLEDNIDYLNLEQEICIPTNNGKIQMILKKDFSERLVTIEGE